MEMWFLLLVLVHTDISGMSMTARVTGGTPVIPMATKEACHSVGSKITSDVKQAYCISNLGELERLK